MGPPYCLIEVDPVSGPVEWRKSKKFAAGLLLVVPLDGRAEHGHADEAYER